jgi:hypothetical protein
VVTATEGPELLAGTALEVLHTDVELAETSEQRAGTGAEVRRERIPGWAVVLLTPDRYCFFDRQPEGLQVVGQVACRQVGLERGHATADVHAHGCGSDGAAQSHDRTDRSPFTQVDVGHHGDMVRDPGQTRDVLQLTQRRGIDVAERRPQPDRNPVPLDELVWHASSPPPEALRPRLEGGQRARTGR